MGCGYWGPNLLRNLVQNSRCQVTQVVELSPDRQNFVRQNFPTLMVSGDPEEIFQNPDIGAVVLATPADTHFDLTIQALKAGKHVLVEKPMAKTTDQVRMIQSTAAQFGKVAMVGHTFLYNSAVRYIKKYIDSGELGEVRYIYAQRLNLGRIRSDVDALWNLAPHDVSIIQYLLNNPTPLSITRVGMDYLQKGIDDVVFLDVVYPGKIMAHIHVSWLDPTKIRRMTIVGSKKMLVYDDVAEDKIVIYDKGIDKRAILGENMDFDNPANFKLNYRHGDVLLPHINFEEPLKLEIDHFLDCIEKKIPCLSGPAHALEVVRVIAGEI